MDPPVGTVERHVTYPTKTEHVQFVCGCDSRTHAVAPSARLLQLQTVGHGKHARGGQLGGERGGYGNRLKQTWHPDVHTLLITW